MNAGFENTIWKDGNWTRPGRGKLQACNKIIRQREKMNWTKRFSETDKGFFKLGILNNFIRYTEKKKRVEWIFLVSILIFSVGYTQFPRWLQQESLWETATDAHAPRWHFVRDDRAARDTRKGSAIGFYFWPGIKLWNWKLKTRPLLDYILGGWQFYFFGNDISVYCYKQGIYKGVVYNNPHQKNMQGAKK